MPEAERTVVLTDNVSNDEAAQVMAEAPRGIAGVKEAVPNFTKVRAYTTFDAEYAVIDSDIVIHFFPSQEVKEARKSEGENYWHVAFADALNDIGQEHFNATKPRLIAKYTEELMSWWVKAQGYDHILDVPAFMVKFFDKMDARLEPHLKQISRS